MLLVFRKKPGILGQYKAFLVEPVLVFFDSETTGGGVEPGELQELAEYLYSEGTAQLEEAGFSVVGQPGPGVARVRLAITGVQPIRPARNVGSKVAGMALGIGLLVPSVEVGGAAIEAEIVDSETGERLVAIVASDQGRRFFNLKNSASRWGDTKAVLRAWAKAFRERLESVRDAGSPETSEVSP